jgi:hypothetical protein
MNPPSKDIAELLEAESSLELTLATNLFYGRLPDTPDVCVSVLDNPGDPPMITLQKNTSAYFYSSVCVQIRDVDYTSGWEKAQAILTYLHALNHTNSIDDTATYGVVKAMNDPQLLYWDKNDRVVFFINFETQRKPI